MGRTDRSVLVRDAVIYSLEHEKESYSAMLIEHGKIARLYDRDPNPATLQVPTIDGHGKAILPGLIDGHAHFMPTAGLHEMALNISEIRANTLEPHDLQSVFAKIHEYARNRDPRLPVLCFNYIIPSIAEDRLPLREELDRCLPNRAIIVISMDGHSSAYSSAGLRLMGIDPSHHSGLLEGEAHEFQMGRLNEVVLQFLSLPTLIRGVQNTFNDALQHGLTGMHCLEGFEDSAKDMVMWFFTHFMSQSPLHLRLFPQYCNLDRMAKIRPKLRYPRIS